MFRTKAVLSKQRGASLIEYALLVALIAIMCIPAVKLIGSKSSEQFSCTAQSISGDTDCSGGSSTPPPPGPGPGPGY